MLILRKAGKMIKNSFSLNKRKIYHYSVLFLVFVLLIPPFVVAAPSYVPFPPKGNTTGDINVEYRYTINTVEVGSSWMFDWGDGTYSDWIVLEGSNLSVSQTHSWDEYGEYQVKIKYKSIYSSESPWSSPLIVNISPPTDIDEDGWSNEIEEAYGKNPEDPDEYPLDTDSDGIPDENSIDGKYIGDTDDDADGLIDSVEELLGSNPKDNEDIETIFVKNKLFYIVDTNDDGTGDILYNLQYGSKTKIKNQDGFLYLDIDGDGEWDYRYNGELFVYTPFPWLQIILAAIGIILIILAILFRTGIIYVYEEEVVVEK